jgi:hypothetical protein
MPPFSIQWRMWKKYNPAHVFREKLPDHERVVLNIPPRDYPQKVSIYLTNISCMRLRDISIPGDYEPVHRNRSC